MHTDKKTHLFHFLHYADKSCTGYDKYLKKSTHGDWFVFNPRFLFTQVFFFIYHKMYLETFLYTLLFSGIINLSIAFPFLSISLILGTMIIASFLSYKIYELKNERLLRKYQYDSYQFLKAVNVSNPVFFFIRLILGYILIAWVTLFITVTNLYMLHPEIIEKATQQQNVLLHQEIIKQ